MKVLRPGRLTDVGAVRGLQGEAEVLASVNHPAIARLLQPGLDAEQPHIVLELVDGPRLSTLIRRFGPLEVEQAASLVAEVASALHYLHGASIVRLDVKPKPRHGSAVPADRPQHRAVVRSGRAAGCADRNGCLHGAGAVQAVTGFGRPAGGRLGLGGHALTNP